MQTIPLLNLAATFIPVLIALGILYRWEHQAGNALYALGRMLIQLLAIGYLLAYIFETEHSGIVLAVLGVMLLTSSWIGLRTVKSRRREVYKYAFVSILLGGGSTLMLVTQGVLMLDPWFKPQYMIPLAGMIFANAMNGVSLSAERLSSEIQRGTPYEEARKTALNAALIPTINALFAVGLVSLPGMMTGQILTGVSPLIAARYQIMVMAMVFGASVLSTATFLTLAGKSFKQHTD